MTVLDVRELAIQYRTRQGVTQALDGATLTLEAGEFVAVVGESGSGKSTLGTAVLGMLPDSAVRTGGDLSVDGQSIFSMTARSRRDLRKKRLGFISQDAAGSLDPTRRIWRQVSDAAPHFSRPDVIRALERMRLADPERVAISYPHELSGGMAQRVAIAITLARAPSVVVADEPTAALDTEIKREILELLADESRSAGVGLLVLTHDIVGIAAVCTRIAVMYGGRVVESGEPGLLHQPRHPYTLGLMSAVPGVEPVEGVLASIPGSPPHLRGPAVGCAFAARCGFAVPLCVSQRPEPRPGDGRRALCHRADEVEALGAVAVPTRTEVVA